MEIKLGYKKNNSYVIKVQVTGLAKPAHLKMETHLSRYSNCIKPVITTDHHWHITYYDSQLIIIEIKIILIRKEPFGRLGNYVQLL